MVGGATSVWYCQTSRNTIFPTCQGCSPVLAGIVRSSTPGATGTLLALPTVIPAFTMVACTA